jgi:hypothetical protein
VAERRKRFDERTAAGHDLRPAARDLVEGCELLIKAHRIVGRKHRHRARETDALGARRRGRERDRRRRDRVVRPVVLAEPEHVESDRSASSTRCMTSAKVRSTPTGSPVFGSRRVSAKV